MCKITCMCVRLCLSLHVFGVGVFNQDWPFITTVLFFLRHQNTIRLHAGAQYVCTPNSAWRTCLNDNNKQDRTFENQFAECSQSWVQTELTDRSESTRCGVNVQSETQVCYAGLCSNRCILGRHCNRERKKEKLSSVCFAGSISGQNEANALGLYFFFCARPRWKAKSQSSKTWSGFVPGFLCV